MGNLSLLLVDDETELIHTLAERLKLRDIHAEFTDNAKEAINMVKEKHFDMVILDVVLQQARGLDILCEIKSIKPDLPVLLISGRGSKKDLLEGKEMGACDYLIKPFQIEELLKIIERVTNT